jgi:hypothetical protein
LDRLDHLELRLGDDDVVLLSRFELRHARRMMPDVVAVIEGEADDFPPFEIPVYEGPQGAVEVRPGHYQEMGFDGGLEQQRLNMFAHLTRPYPWFDDPRQSTLHRLVSTNEPEFLQSVSTQDLWDSMFAIARAERFGGGAIAANAEGLTAVANEIRRRLISAVRKGRHKLGTPMFDE